MSRKFGLSEQYLVRLFKERKHLTVNQYINEQKIKVAKLLLLETSLSVQEISEYAYFKNEKQFFYQFRRIVGMTPLKFRQLHGPIHKNNPNYLN
ncbi:helix-turn-helix transcriptional regulator [Lentilactobacillus hilgardii]|nr:helix-turn-helix transcriptional regulator [Lentilactobacillus hilgardii]MCV3740868.1 helix-turn-helix transcriptional regulator [Lentilactobacillus hilgardii]